MEPVHRALMDEVVAVAQTAHAGVAHAEVAGLAAGAARRTEAVAGAMRRRPNRPLEAAPHQPRRPRRTAAAV